ncbi:MAG: ABC transporter substrate-binding protein [Pseudomonadota bacterium]
MKFSSVLVGVGLAVAIASGSAAAGDKPTVRLGLLKFGTVNWEADTIKREGLDTKHGFSLEIVPFASGNATDVALLSGDVQISTGDWLFASRQRAAGDAIAFVPYSTSMGAVMAPCGGEIKTLSDLKGKTIGVAGGPVDKSWLMIQGMAQGDLGFDLKAETDQVFGAPPLLAEKLRQGELDATLNYWHYNARLENEGYCQVVSAQEAAEMLGAEHPLSAIGYIFNEEWANDNPAAAAGFVAASREAKSILATSDEAWEALKPRMKAENDAVYKTLVTRWREGIPSGDVKAEQRDTETVYRYLAEAGGEKLVGTAREMQPGTFWAGLFTN